MRESTRAGAVRRRKAGGFTLIELPVVRERKSPSRRGAGQAGFTLIELLVVIAIIALLVSIMVPSLQQARELARNSLCLSNERQIGTAFAFYRHDFNNFYPPGTWIYSWSWDANWVYDENLESLGYLGSVVTIVDQADPYCRHILGSELWSCPSATDRDYAGGVPANRTGRGYGYSLELLNYWYTHAWSGYSYPVRAHDKPIVVIGDRNLACYFGIMQGCDLGWPGSIAPDPNYESAYTTSLRHGGHVNYLFSDGHSEGLTLAQAMNTDLWRWDRYIPP